MQMLSASKSNIIQNVATECDDFVIAIWINPVQHKQKTLPSICSKYNLIHALYFSKLRVLTGPHGMQYIAVIVIGN